MAKKKPTAMLAPDPAASSSAHSCSKRLSLADALDRLLHCGVAAQGNLTIGVADVELLFVDLRVLLGSVDTIWPEGRPAGDPIPPQSPFSLPPPQEPLRDEEIKVAADRIEPHRIGAGAGAGIDFGLPAAPSERRATGASSSTAQGLVRLALTLVKLLHDVIERQAIRRMESGRLTEVQIDNIGTALLAQAEEISRLQRQFHLTDQDLSFDLGTSESRP